MALIAVVLLTCLPQAASACVACRQAAASMVYGANFIDHLLTLLLPVALLLVAGLLIYQHGSVRRRLVRRPSGGR